MNQHTHDSEFTPLDASVPNPIPQEDTAEAPRAVPRSGIGNPDAWNDYREKHSDIYGEPLEDSTTWHGSDDELPDPALVPELAPLVAENLDEHHHDNDEAEEEVTIVETPNNIVPAEPPADIDPNAPRGGEQDLWSHLGELRSRILHSIVSVLIASVVTWNYGQQISEFFARPIRDTLTKNGVNFQLVTIDPTEGFLVYFQITLVSAIFLAMPYILFQMWRFIEPALTGTERRFSVILVPFSVVLFFMGCALGYAVSPLFFNFFLMFQPPGTTATFSYGTSIVLLAKMVLVFGICFQVPVITIFLTKIGLITRNFLIDYWRHAFVVIFTVVAILTPTWDPLTLVVCAGPPCVLYALSIWMVKWL